MRGASIGSWTRSQLAERAYQTQAMSSSSPSNKPQSLPAHDPNSFKRIVLDFLSGGVAGGISKTVTAPLERVKLLMQTQHENIRLVVKYKSISDCFIRCVKEEGITSLWRGNGVNIIRYFPTQALNFSFKERFNQLFNPYNPTTESRKFFFGSILSGGCAGAATTLFVYPLDFARTRMGVDIGRDKSQRQFKGIADCMRQVVKNDGIKGIYNGFGISVFGIFIYRGLYFGLYDFCKAVMLPKDKQNSILWKYLAAQFAVITSETIAYPTDTIKRKMMMQSARGERQYRNSFDCMRQTYATAGVQGFFVGCASNILRSIGSSACLVLYDEIRQLSFQL